MPHEGPATKTGGPTLRYEFTENANGTYNVYSVPVFGEVEPGVRGNKERVGKGWQQRALTRAQLREKEGYLPPLHEQHHLLPDGRANPNVKPAGKIRFRRITKRTYTGKPMSFMVADYLRVPEATFRKLQNGDLSYASIEVSSWEDPEIGSCALLEAEPPAFKLPTHATWDADFRGGYMLPNSILCQLSALGGSLMPHDKYETEDYDKKMEMAEGDDPIEKKKDDGEEEDGGGEEGGPPAEFSDEDGDASGDAEDAGLAQPDTVPPEGAEEMGGEDPMMNDAQPMPDEMGMPGEEAPPQWAKTMISLMQQMVTRLMPEAPATNMPEAVPAEFSDNSAAQPTDGNDAQPEPETSKDKHYSKTSRLNPSRVTGGKNAFSELHKLQAEMAGMKAANRERDRKETAEALAVAAETDLEGRHIDDETRATLRQFAAQGEDQLRQYVDTIKRLVPEDPDDMLPGWTSNSEPVMAEFREMSPKKQLTARALHPAYERAKKRGQFVGTIGEFTDHATSEEFGND